MQPRRILLVDEERAILAAMGDYFCWLGFQVEMASTVEEAQALLRAQRYAGVVADLRLAGSEAQPGLQLSRMARALSAKTRILLLSREPVQENEARRHGADAVLLKPQLLPEVARCLISLLEGAA